MSKLIELLKKGLEANPGDWNIRKGLIEQCIQAGEYDALTEVIRTAPEMCRDEATVQELADRLAEVNETAAILFIDQAIETFPSNSSLHGIAARLRLASGDMAAANDHYQAARTFDPGFSDPDLDAVAHLMMAASGEPPTVTSDAPTLDPVGPELIEATDAESIPVDPQPIEYQAVEPEQVEAVPVEPAPAEPVAFEAEPVEIAASEEEQEAEISYESVIDEATEHAEEPLPEESAQQPLETLSSTDETWQAAENPDEFPAVDLSQTQSVAVVASLEPAKVPAVPIQGLSAPEPVELAFEEVEPAVDLNFVPSAELELTRQHLNVLDPSGLEMDADQFDAAYEEIEQTTGAGLLVAEPARAPEAAEKKNNKEKLTAILITVAAHVVIFFLIGLVIVAMPKVLPPEIVASPGPVTTEEAITKKEVVQQTPTQPPAPSTASINTISSFGASAVSVPAVEFEAPEETVDLGSDFGSGLSFGTGSMAAGGEISFMGNSGSGSRVVFAVDMSLSMGGFPLDQKPPPSEELIYGTNKKKLKHQLLRRELVDSIRKLPTGTQYQIVMFAHLAWAHDSIDMEWLDDPQTYKRPPSARAGTGWFRQQLDKNKKDVLSQQGKGWDVDDFEFPRFKYVTASDANIKKSIQIIERTPTVLGTNWEHPVLMALSIKPTPDIIFFMTDGAVGQPERAIELITEANKGRTVINTTVMMEPKAIEHFDNLASRNRGKFTMVDADGKIVKGEKLK